MNDASKKIQKVVRGHTGRKKAALENVLKTKASQISKQTLDDAMKDIIQEDAAATTISSVLRGHEGRKKYIYEKDVYPQQKAIRQAQILNTEPSSLLQRKPKTLYSRSVDTKKGNIKEKYENVLKNSSIGTTLQTRSLQNDAAIKIQSAVRNRNALKELYKREDTKDSLDTILDNTMSKIKERKSAANTLKSAWKGRKARQELYDKAHNFNPEGYQELLRANLKKYKSVESEHRTRNTQPQEKLNKAARHISSIQSLFKKKSAAGRPSGTFLNPRLTSGGDTSRLSMLSTTSTIPPNTPKKK